MSFEVVMISFDVSMISFKSSMISFEVVMISFKSSMMSFEVVMISLKSSMMSFKSVIIYIFAPRKGSRTGTLAKVYSFSAFLMPCQCCEHLQGFFYLLSLLSLAPPYCRCFVLAANKQSAPISQMAW